MSDANTSVEYRPIEGFPGYRVGDDGSVWSCLKRGGSGYQYVPVQTWRRLSPRVRDRSGHLGLQLRGKDFHVHTIVLLTFVGQRPTGMECCHYDGDPTNNNLSNLRWGTHRENINDRQRHGRTANGERHPMAKLSDVQVSQIRAMATTKLQREIGERFGITQAQVSNILLGRQRK